MAEITSDSIVATNLTSVTTHRRNHASRLPSNSNLEAVQPQDLSPIFNDLSPTAPHFQSIRPVNDDISIPFFLSTGNHPGLILVSNVLNGSNYQSWKRGITMALAAKKKISFIDGSLPRTEIDNPSLNSWLICNNMVMSWLVNSVSQEIAQSIMYFDLATDMWNDLAERFNEGNGPRIFQLQTQLTRLQQGEQSVSSFFTKMKSLWDELKEFQPITTSI
ncbi:uncharacterized protein LOC133033137 [Cannabis sativa]|uniref:uncharacterized protein LOC133033137 n=1 Tax=Cannabis sativa TaxID=3483 RepID=UPI0029CAA23E|nr:uncharacterized protein LOC133033137 [Cannabis sativa]